MFKFLKKKKINPKIQEFMKNANFREVVSPVKMKELRKIPSHVERIQFSSPLKERDYQILGTYFEDNPHLQLRVYLYKDEIDLEFLKYFGGLKGFSLDVNDIQNVNGIEYLPPDLEYFGFGSARKKSISLKFLKKFPGLKRLYLEGHKKDIEVVGELPGLEKLDLRSITLPSLEIFTSLNTLWWFTLKLGGTRNLKALPEMGKLKYLELWRIRGLEDISVISEIETLQFLFLQTLNRIQELPDFTKLKSLRRIHLETLKGISDLKPLLKAKSLEEITIYDMHHLKNKDYDVLFDHPTLKNGWLGIRNNKERERINELLGFEGLQTSGRTFPYE